MSGLKNGAGHGNFSTVDAEVSNTQLTDVMAHAGIQFASWLMFEGFGRIALAVCGLQVEPG
ncbi:hypothetical protein [Streptomyces tendae]